VSCGAIDFVAGGIAEGDFGNRAALIAECLFDRGGHLIHFGAGLRIDEDDFTHGASCLDERGVGEDPEDAAFTGGGFFRSFGDAGGTMDSARDIQRCRDGDEAGEGREC
jgi:hypothetical protein